MRYIITVARERAADMLEALADIADNVTPMSDTSTGPKRHNVPTVETTTDVETVETAAPVRNVFHARPGKRVLYTPALTAAKMKAALAKLEAGTMRALVLNDIVKHPKSTNGQVRSRIAVRAAKLGLSVESVDNVIWQAVNRGELAKLSAD